MAKNKPSPAHQFALFSFEQTKPKLKVPISAKRIEEARALIAKGDGKNAALVLRNIREGLENFEKRLR